MLLIGDSHVRPLTYIRIDGINVVSVSGATMSGVVNPNSKTNARAIFLKSIQSERPNIVVSSLGEVDVGFLCLINSKNEEEAKHSIVKSMKRYLEFLQELTELGIKVYCCTIPLPYMKDEELRKAKIKMRRRIDFDLSARIKLTEYFNDQLLNNWTNVLDLALEFENRKRD